MPSLPELYKNIWFATAPGAGMQLDPSDYGSVFSSLLETDRNRPLDAGTPVADACEALRDLQVEAAFAGAPVVDRAMAECCISGVWLLYDFLDESHTISQRIHNASGSFWHGIMHRREGDYSNSKYWFRQVGEHPVFPQLLTEAQDLASSADPRKSGVWAEMEAWDPFRFVDQCQAAAGGQTADEKLLRRIQQAEWELLFDHCYQCALGSQ